MAVKTTTQCSTYRPACCPNPSWWSLPKPRLYTGRNCFLMAAQFESHSGARALLFWAREPGMRSSREAVIGSGRTSGGVAFERPWPRAAGQNLRYVRNGVAETFTLQLTFRARVQGFKTRRPRPWESTARFLERFRCVDEQESRLHDDRRNLAGVASKIE